MKFSDLVLLAEMNFNSTEKFANFVREVTGMAESESDDFIKWFVNIYSHECFRDEGLIDPELLGKIDYEVQINSVEYWMDYLRNYPDSASDMFDYLANFYESITYNVIGQHNSGLILASDKKKMPTTLEIKKHIAQHMYNEYKKHKSLMSGLKAFKLRKQQ